MSGELLVVQQDGFNVGKADGSLLRGLASRLGLQVTMDFYTYMALSGAAFNVRAGTITTPLVGDVLITDTAAEYCIDSPAGTTLIPVFTNISFRLAGGTLFECAGKSVATASTVGTAFVALPVRSAGKASATATAALCTARVSAAGGVTVTAEVVTTTPRHFSWSQPIAAGAWPTWYDWNPRVPPILPGIRCFYVQIAGTGTGPSYYSSTDFIECPTADIL